MAAREPAPGFTTAKTATNLPAGPIIFVIGPPGAGKANLCAHICKIYPGHFRHLSVGPYVRELFSNKEEEASILEDLELCAIDSETGCLPPDEIEKYVRENRTLPPETIIPLIKAELLSCDPLSSAGWLIEGFPRDVKTALAFEREIKMPTALIKVVCDPKFSRERFLNRQRITPDIEERFRRRMEEHDENWRDICTHYGSLEVLIKVDSNGGGWVTSCEVSENFHVDLKRLVALTGSRERQ